MVRDGIRDELGADFDFSEHDQLHAQYQAQRAEIESAQLQEAARQALQEVSPRSSTGVTSASTTKGSSPAAQAS